MMILIQDDEGHVFFRELTQTEWDGLQWAIIKGADCEQEICYDILEGLNK
ncbi:MAG: hypothetical protein ACREHG_05865 [Candidatus Saccharimonadales bacterium]